MNNFVSLEVNGISYQGFENINYYKNIEDLSGTFSFTASTENKEFTPFKGQEPCRIMINNRPILTGFIESLTYSYSNSSHSIIVSGRDKTSDIIDNTIIGDVQLNAPITLENLIKEVLDRANLLDKPDAPDTSNLIKVINQAGKLKPFEKSELSSGEAELGFDQNESATAKVGENMFEFIEKYCRKRGVLLTSDGDGNVVIARSGQELLEGTLLNEITKNNNRNNIKNASINYDFSNRYNKYICRSQGNASAFGLIENEDGFGLASLAGTKGEAIDDEIRTTRVIEFLNETSAINSSDEQRANWEANIRRSRSVVYTCEVNHLFVDKENTSLYEPNKRIQVKDDFCDIDSLMLIRSISYDLSAGEGTSITLELVPIDAYTPQPSKDQIESRYNKIGEFVLPTGIVPGSRVLGIPVAV